MSRHPRGVAASQDVQKDAPGSRAESGRDRSRSFRTSHVVSGQPQRDFDRHPAGHRQGGHGHTRGERARAARRRAHRTAADRLQRAAAGGSRGGRAPLSSRRRRPCAEFSAEHRPFASAVGWTLRLTSSMRPTTADDMMTQEEGDGHDRSTESAAQALPAGPARPSAPRKPTSRMRTSTTCSPRR